MKASLQWMNEYVPVNLERPAQELADVLTQAGIPVEEVQSLDTGIKKIYTGKIIEITKHPDADKLQVCQVECLDEEGNPVVKQIVTAATNVAVGQVVPVAYHKSRLADGTEIKKGKLRGQVSEGMFCSVAEFGLSKDLVLPGEAEGIYIFPENTPIGQDVKTVLGLDDTVYEFELTPNRADCFSMIGLSREFAVLSGTYAFFPDVHVREESGEPIEGRLHIKIDNEELCSRFMGRLIENVTIEPSPLWMQNRLRAAGIRPINNIVDVTNYVMIEWGQPMHAYDYDEIHGQTLVARSAKANETIKTLDGSDRALSESMLVISDTDRPVGVAGIMGGFDSEVTDKTTSVVLEAAVFNGASVRRSARSLGMRSEASGRFERGVNSEFTPFALDRAAQLILAICPTAKIAQGVIDVYPHPKVERTLTFTAKAINDYLGTNIEEQEMMNILTGLSFGVEKQGDEVLVRIPSWRDDVSVMPDIAEEVARIYSYDNIAVTMPTAKVQSGELSPRKALVKQVKHGFVGAGLNEIITFSFMHKDLLTKLNIPESDRRYTAIPIMNPISEEFPYMRTTLMGSVLEAAMRNQAQKNLDLPLFEVGAVYEPVAVPVTELPKEHYMAAGIITGKAHEAAWNQSTRAFDFYDVKGMLEHVLSTLFVENLSFRRSNEYYLHPGVSADVYSGDVKVAQFGELHPVVAKAYDIVGKAYVFELDLDAILGLNRGKIAYEAISKFPGITRDLAIVAPKDVAYEDIMNIIRTHGGEYLEQAYIFDVYEGEHIADGFRSLAYSLSFKSQDGTLTDGDIEGNIESILRALEEKNCTLR